MVSLKGKIPLLIKDLNLNPNLGQHLLVDEKIIDQIINIIPPKSLVLEIGAGCGQITRKLLQNHCQVIAVEIDKKFAPFLEKLKKKYKKRLKIVYQDILKFNWESLSSSKNLWLTGSLPYHITEPLFHKLIFVPFKEAIFLVGARFAFETQLTEDFQNFGKLTLLIQSFFNPQVIEKIPKNSFFPQPKVNSAILRLTPKTKNDYQKNPFLKIFKELFLSAPRGPLIKNALRETLIRQKLAKTKKEAKKIISQLNLPQEILQKPLEQLNNQQLYQLYYSLRSFLQRL
ncbi:MAG: ribosomal RNA small subunit methyltransferase A [Microgenomates group bacterium]